MSIRFKMTTIAVAVILLANSLLSFIALRYLGSVWLQEVQTRVQRNLNSARSAYEKRVELIAAFLQGTAHDPTLAEVIGRNDLGEVECVLYDIQQAGGMDFVTLLDPAGEVIRRARGERHGDRLADDLLVGRALRERQTVTGTVIFSRERLLAEGADLADRARFELVPTPAARPTPDTVRYDGMVVAAVVPVLDAQGQMRALLYGGNLLNRRYEIVDAIKQEVFPQESLPRQGHRHRDHLPGRLADLDQRHDGRRLAGGGHAAERVGVRSGAGPRRHLGRSGLRRQRLVHHGLRADPRSGRAGHRRALRRAAAGSFHPSAERHQRGLPGHRGRRHPGQPGACCCWRITWSCARFATWWPWPRR